MNMLSRAAGRLLALLACLMLIMPPAYAQALDTPNPSFTNRQGPTAFTGSEWFEFRQNGIPVTARISTVLAQAGVRPVASTITASAATVANDPSVSYFMNSASAQTLTIASGMTRYPLGSVITVVQLGAGAVTLAAGSGVTINKRSSTLVSKGQFALIQLTNIGTDTWIATGDLT